MAVRNGLFLATFVTTVFCAAVNLYTWRLGYPLWRSAGPAFAAVHREYLRRLDLVITLPHVLMFFASGTFVFLRPPWVGFGPALWVFLLDTLAIGVSIGVAGPVHGRFTRTGVADEPGMRRLVRISAWRSGLLAVSCGLLVWMLSAGLARNLPSF